MPIVNADNAKRLTAAGRTAAWRPLHAIEGSDGNVLRIAEAAYAAPFERRVLAEGDSWFDKFTPIPRFGNNLLELIETPFYCGLVDASLIGDTARAMTRGHLWRQTRRLMDRVAFDAILLSAGGNDLRALFEHADAEAPFTLQALLDDPAADHLYDGILDDLKRFVAARDACDNPTTRDAPIFVHGYDHLQPRPAKAALFGPGILKLGRPEIYPILQDAGLDDDAMRDVARTVIDAFNTRLRDDLARLRGVHVIDQRGVLDLAAPGSTGESGDWIDEIHTSAKGYRKLAQHRWNVALSVALGWKPQPGDVAPA